MNLIVFALGDRVIQDGQIGRVEEIEDIDGYPIYTIRWETPEGEPSIYSTYSDGTGFRPCADNIKTMPWNAEKKADAKLFYDYIAGILKEEGVI